MLMSAGAKLSNIVVLAPDTDGDLESAMIEYPFAEWVLDDSIDCVLKELNGYEFIQRAHYRTYLITVVGRKRLLSSLRNTALSIREVISMGYSHITRAQVATGSGQVNSHVTGRQLAAVS
jgi:hypothetical protein